MAFKAVQKLSSPPQCTSWQDRMRDYAWRSFLPMRRQGTEAVLLLTCLSLPLFLNTFIAPQEWITLTERCWKCGMSLAIGLSLLTNVLKSTLVRNDGFNRYCRCDLAMTLLLVPFPVHLEWFSGPRSCNCLIYVWVCGNFRHWPGPASLEHPTRLGRRFFYRYHFNVSCWRNGIRQIR